MSQTVTPGRIVLYTLTKHDAEFIVEHHHAAIGRTLNAPSEGDVYPALVVRVWSDTCVNLKVELDGEPTFWATSRTEGEDAGYWAWPPRA